MTYKIFRRLPIALFIGIAVITEISAQTVAYRQTNLTSSVDTQGFAQHVNPFLQNPWGIAFPSGQAFFIANTANGRVLAEDGNGNGAPGAFAIPNPARTGPALPTGIIADPTSLFGAVDPRDPFVTTVITATADGGIYVWGIDAQGNSPTEAALVVDHSREGAVYTALAILTPQCCAPFLAIANFHTGEVETYNTSFVPLAPPGSFVDPELPAGYAPFGLQVIGNNLFIAYALQDTDKHNPLTGPGNGLVSVFSLEGNFVRRFATGGLLNAPWGISQAGPDFGPLANDILIAGTGDGAVSAFDPTGEFAGQIVDGDGNQIHDAGLHGLFFGSAQAGEQNTLYFTAGINLGQDGLFGKITTGLVSRTSVSASAAEAGVPMTISIAVAPSPGNTGVPTGTVTIRDGGNTLGTPALTDGSTTLDATLTGVGIHDIRVLYNGDAIFLASTGDEQVEVKGRSTTTALSAPALAPPGSAVKLTATMTSSVGVPGGQVSFLDGTSTLGTASVDATGAATLIVTSLAGGGHMLTAAYLGDSTFLASVSTPVGVTIADFSFGADHSSAAVAAGQSAQFVLSVDPTTNFANNISFSCASAPGISCAFNPAAVSPGNGRASTTLTITTSRASSAGVAKVSLSGGASPILHRLFVTWMVAFAVWFGTRRAMLRAAAPALILAGAALTFTGCGGGGSSMNVNRGTNAVTVTAQVGAVTHSIVLNVTSE